MTNLTAISPQFCIKYPTGLNISFTWSNYAKKIIFPGMSFPFVLSHSKIRLRFVKYVK